MRLLRVGLLSWACAYCINGQPGMPATVDELKYLRFLLMNVGSIDRGPESVARFELGIAKLSVARSPL